VLAGRDALARCRTGKFGVFSSSASCKALENLPAYLSVMFITDYHIEAARLQAERAEICSGQAVLGDDGV